MKLDITYLNLETQLSPSNVAMILNISIKHARELMRSQQIFSIERTITKDKKQRKYLVTTYKNVKEYSENTFEKSQLKKRKEYKIINNCEISTLSYKEYFPKFTR